MPFGLSNTPTSFQGYIKKILAKKLDIFVIVYLDNILIYTKDSGQGHVEVVRWVLDLLEKNGLFANLKKCRFHKDEVRFLGYVVSSHDIQIEDEKNEAVKNWPEPKSVRDIQVFIGFANFYRRFIRDFSRIATPLNSMLKTTGSSNLFPGDDDDEVVGGGGDRNLSKFKKSKNAKSGNQTCIKATEEPKFLTSKPKEAFNLLRQVFTKTPILWHFDPECHIRIETNTSGYTIGGVLSRLSSDQLTSKSSSISSKSDFGQWYPIAYFSRMIIQAETCYETHDAELLAIVEAFKTWRYYLKGCKHEVLVLTNHNNLCHFMDIKNLQFSSGLVGTGVVSLPFSNWLPLGQGKYSCRRLISLSSKKSS